MTLIHFMTLKHRVVHSMFIITYLTGFIYELNDTQGGPRAWRNGIYIF